MKEIIQKAIEGGFEPDGLVEIYFNEVNDACRAITLDPLFWQALGKACGWEKTIVEHFEGNKPYVMRMFKGEAWMYRYMHFHEINLTEGWNKAVEYLSALVK